MALPDYLKVLRHLLPPDVRLLAAVRDPVRRAYSHFKYHLERGYDCEDWPGAPCFPKFFRNGTFRNAVCYALNQLGGEAYLDALAALPSPPRRDQRGTARESSPARPTLCSTAELRPPLAESPQAAPGAPCRRRRVAGAPALRCRPRRRRAGEPVRYRVPQQGSAQLATRTGEERACNANFARAAQRGVTEREPAAWAHFAGAWRLESRAARSIGVTP